MDSQISIKAPETGSCRPVKAPKIIERPDHNVSRSQISDNALKVLYRLKDAGYQAYLVGGGVRDLLLGMEPKDFDIATDAHPEDVRELFRNCRLIGRRFRLAHVHFGREIIEVATFRAGATADSAHEIHENGRILRDNVYGNIEEDAFRRDFTLNALYYDIRDFSVVDYTGGLEDLKARRLRLIGDPVSRYQEDPVRMLRAIRFAAKLDCVIEASTEGPMKDLAHLLTDVPAARLFDEVIKLFHGGQALKTFRLLREYGLLGYLFPDVSATLNGGANALAFVERSMENTDKRVEAGLPVNPAFIYAVLLWKATRDRFERLLSKGMAPVPAMQQAGREIALRQTQRTALPKRFGIPMQEIWTLQRRFEFKKGKRALRFLSHPRFRAAYDFYCLRSDVGETENLDCQWWTEFQESHPEAKADPVRSATGPAKRSRRRPRRRKPDAN